MQDLFKSETKTPLKKSNQIIQLMVQTQLPQPLTILVPQSQKLKKRKQHQLVQLLLIQKNTMDQV